MTMSDWNLEANEEAGQLEALHPKCKTAWEHNHLLEMCDACFSQIYTVQPMKVQS